MTNLLEKKIEDYDYDAYNFVADDELMVKITLAEYRKLVATAACAEADIREANNARWATEEELKKCKAELEALRASSGDEVQNVSDVPAEPLS